MASVRFICGTQEAHRELEERLAAFLGTEEAILFGSCFDANGGLFEALLGPEDAVISDALNHASIIDGIRLCKARRLRFANGDMDELEARLSEAGRRPPPPDRHRRRVLDGRLLRQAAEICDLAERHDAIVMVDDSHAVGFVGEGGRGTHELHGVIGRVDIITGTLGKAMGGASGGYVAAPRRDRRAAAPARAAVPVLEQPRAADRGRQPACARPDRALGRPARAPARRTRRTSARG